jgi:hypothetical protein
MQRGMAMSPMRWPAAAATFALAFGCLAYGSAPAVASGGPTAALVRVAAGGTWGKAEEVPGIAALNTGEHAQIYSVSCASAGNCSAGGYYTDTSGHYQAFVVTQAGGTWGKAEEVPGIAALNTGGSAGVESVSCASAGDCSAGGEYTDSLGDQQVFVVTQVGGTWGKAEEVPGIAALTAGWYAQISSVSCGSPGNCSAGGVYNDNGNANEDQPFVVTQAGGTWGKAEKVPGVAALSADVDSAIDSVSCASAGDCSAGGYYGDGSSSAVQAFVVTQAGGTWGKAEEVPGIAALNTGGGAEIYSVSCASAGNCSAGGYYTDTSGHYQAFVVTRAGGTWGKAEEVPGIAALNKGGNAVTMSVSCASAGNCSAGGYYGDGSSSGGQAFVVTQASGTWGKAEEVPGTAALNKGGSAGVESVSCASAGNCSAGGHYLDSSGLTQVFVVAETQSASAPGRPARTSRY